MPEKQEKTRTDGIAGDARLLRECDTWVFDLDNTLYPPSASMFDEIDRRMCAYIADYLKLDHAEAYKVQKRYFREHGTSLKGLMDNHDMDPAPYLDYVHAVSVDMVQPDPDLDRALHALPGRKVVFTNASARHAERVLDRLGVDHHMDGVFDIAAANYIPKPEPSVYRLLTETYEFDPANAVMVEDVARNLKPAAEMGMATVWVVTDRPWANAEAGDVEPDHTVTDLSGWLVEVSGA